MVHANASNAMQGKQGWYCTFVYQVFTIFSIVMQLICNIFVYMYTTTIMLASIGTSLAAACVLVYNISIKLYYMIYY